MFKKVILSTALLIGLTTQLYAHAHVAQPEPAEDSVLKKSPATVSVEYTQALELSLSKLVLKDGSGNVVQTGKLEHANGNNKTLSVKVPELKPGTYKVEWGAASVDTHRTEGSYSFKIVP